jgi:SAM-dependent methyltransferase
MARSYELTRCIVCGDANTATLAGPDDIRTEAELLWAFHMRRLSSRTPPARLMDRVAFSQAPPWRVVRCVTCGLVYRNPVERQNELRASYAREAPTRETMLTLHERQRTTYRAQLRRLRAHLSRRGSGLEVGSYSGAFLSAARRARWAFEGLDVNADINALVRSLGFTVHDGDLESFRGDRVFDVVAIWNTFDQLPDPRAAVRAVVRLLRENGVLALRVPNGARYAEWRARLSAGGPTRAVAATMLAHNNLLSFPYRFGFTPATLTRLLHDEGFVVAQIVSAALVPTADEWTRRWAVIEERIAKPLSRHWMPWFELYARRAS